MRFVQCRAAHNEKWPIPRLIRRMTEILKLVLRQRTIHLQIDGRIVIMLLSPHAIRNQK